MYREFLPNPRGHDIEIEGMNCPRCGSIVGCENGYGVVVLVCEHCGYYFEHRKNVW